MRGRRRSWLWPSRPGSDSPTATPCLSLSLSLSFFLSLSLSLLLNLTLSLPLSRPSLQLPSPQLVPLYLSVRICLFVFSCNFFPFLFTCWPLILSRLLLLYLLLLCLECHFTHLISKSVCFSLSFSLPPSLSLPTEVHHQQHPSSGGAVRGQALSGLVPPP